jgi:hypothetical protein
LFHPWRSWRIPPRRTDGGGVGVDVKVGEAVSVGAGVFVMVCVDVGGGGVVVLVAVGAIVGSWNVGAGVVCDVGRVNG